MKRTVPVDEAVGMVLPHDITEIRPGVFKGRAFKKGHIIKQEDIPHLRSLGKEHILILDLGPDEIHEDEAACRLAVSLAGPGTSWPEEPKEGKINILAAIDGLLRINVESLYRFNLLGEVMCATLPSWELVRTGQQIAATRLIPLTCGRALIEEAEAIAAQGPPIVQVQPLPGKKVGLVITGNEVFYGRIKDGFEPVLREKLTPYGSEVIRVARAPDDAEIIAVEIRACLAGGAELIITTGGMSVDPDDVTRVGIALAGARDVVYGSPVLPGAMILVASIEGVPVVGLPACGMFHKITVFDLILPRILCGERISRETLARLGHGGLCRNCDGCGYPVCGLGRGGC